jgi:hypothetical protein
MPEINFPDFIKEPLKFLLRSEDRKRIFSESSIRRKQNDGIRRFDASTRKLVVFMVPGADRQTGTDKISGGIISIVSLCEESSRLKNVHGAETVMCTFNTERLLWRHSQFANNTDVFRFSQVQKYFTQADEIILHLPEFTCEYFLQNLSAADKAWLKGLKKLHINILNQNIRLMPDVEVVNRLKMVANKVTATTAHQRYCNAGYRAHYGIPLHKFSVWISPEKYSFKKYADKEQLIIVSPDQRPEKQAVLDRLAAIPGLKVQIIQNLTYEQYKEVISRAKWALTFGEGLDGYIIEPIFSGAIGFAVYNEEFFTPDFKELPTLYTNYDQLLKRITEDMAKLDNAEAFLPYQQQQFAICARHYSEDEYRRNIQEFYKGNYTLP